MLAHLAAAGSHFSPVCGNLRRAIAPGSCWERTDPFTHGSEPRETLQGFTQPGLVLEVLLGLGCEWHKVRLHRLAGAWESLLIDCEHPALGCSAP